MFLEFCLGLRTADFLFSICHIASNTMHRDILSLGLVQSLCSQVFGLCNFSEVRHCKAVSTLPAYLLPHTLNLLSHLVRHIYMFGLLARISMYPAVKVRAKWYS